MLRLDFTCMLEKSCENEDFTIFSRDSQSTAVELATSAKIQRIEGNIGLQGSAKLLAEKLIYKLADYSTTETNFRD